MLSMAEQRGQRVVQQEKKSVAARAHQKALVACIATTNASPWITSGIPGVVSPSTPGLFNEGPSATPGCVTPYEDALPLGGFNPTPYFTPRRTTQCQQGLGADNASFTGRRDPLEFKGAGGEEEEEGARGWRTTMTMMKRAATKTTTRTRLDTSQKYL
jgi:hypothetical protein